MEPTTFLVFFYIYSTVPGDRLRTAPPTPQECCQNANVPEFCLGMCTPYNARANIGSKLNACSKFEAIIEKCFQPFVDSVIRNELQGKPPRSPKQGLPGDLAN